MRNPRTALAVAVFAMATAALSVSCSPRTKQEPGELVHRVLPTAEELGRDWKQGREEFDIAESPIDYGPTNACREAEKHFPEFSGEGRVIARREFVARDEPGMFAYVYAEQAAGALWLAGYPEQVADFFSSASWGRCYADAFEEMNPRAGTVTERLEEPGDFFANVSGVGWSFRLEGDPTVLRHELYVWTEGPLAMSVQLMGREQDLTEEVAAAVVEVAMRKAAETVP